MIHCHNRHMPVQSYRFCHRLIINKFNNYSFRLSSAYPRRSSFSLNLMISGMYHSTTLQFISFSSVFCTVHFAVNSSPILASIRPLLNVHASNSKIKLRELYVAPTQNQHDSNTLERCKFTGKHPCPIDARVT